MSHTASCVHCGAVSISPDGRWQPGEVCLYGTLFACSMWCAESWAMVHGAVGCRPGEPGFYAEEEPRE